MTPRPSTEPAIIGQKSPFVSGTWLRSFSAPSASLTHTTASGPLLGNPSSFIAAPTGVPALTLKGCAGFAKGSSVWTMKVCAPLRSLAAAYLAAA